MSQEALRRSVEAAMVPMIASFGPWGVDEGHWLPDRDGAPVVWLRTRTEVQRVALQAQPWMLPQVQVILARLGVPPHQVLGLRLEVTSSEAQAGLFEED